MNQMVGARRYAEGDQMPHVRIKWLNWVVVISPTGNLTGDEGTSELHEAINDALAGDYQGVVLNLEKVRFVNSTGVGVIMVGLSVSQRRGARMAVCCVGKRNQYLLEFLDLIPLLPRFDTEDEAIRFCSNR